MPYEPMRHGPTSRPNKLRDWSDKPYRSDPNVCSGTATFQDSRLMVEVFFDYLVSGYSIDRFLEEFEGTVTREQLVHTLELAEEALIGGYTNNEPAVRRHAWEQARSEAAAASRDAGAGVGVGPNGER